MEDSLIASIKGQALTNLRNCIKNGTPFMPVVFLEGAVIGIPWGNDEEKVILLRRVGVFMAQKGIHECLLVVDSYVRKLKGKEDMDYIEQNWDTEMPSLYPEAMRQDALVLSCFDFKDSRDAIYILEYKKVDGDIEVTETSDENFEDYGGAVKDSIAEGFAIGLTQGGRNLDALDEYPSLKQYFIQRHSRRG